METVNVKDLTADQLQQLLDEKKKEEQKAKQAKRKRYEMEREALVEELGGFALNLNNQMADLKYEAMKQLTEFRHKMLEYGQLRNGEKNKGSFEIKTDNFKIMFTHQINKKFDERAQLAEAKLKEFLTTFVKKSISKENFKLITSLLERNPKTGDYDIDLINRLYAMEDSYDHPLWREALKMFKEAYSPNGTAQYVRFFRKDESNNTWEALSLDFAKIKANDDQEATKA